ncbi:MAG: SET domain-containing protein-lysine N-methyltransferase [Candidatus Pacearchaeota archaeon]|jgi:hypothetical protein
MQKIDIKKDISVRKSGIHNSGVYAEVNIVKGTKIIEYIGEKITKEEAEKRENNTYQSSKNNSNIGADYIFELDDKFDIDGNFDYNTARLINHSCNPNCEIEISNGHIWFQAKRDIKVGEELTFNYGYDDLKNYKKHPCRCGSKNCVGYILAEELWDKIKKDK